MPVHRRRFRIEEAIVGDMPMSPEVDSAEVGPMHHEIMSELRAIRAQMGAPAQSAVTGTIGDSVTRETAEAHALLETYRAQIEQCEKLKVELDLIYDAISRTKREIAVLHGNSFNGEEMAKVNGELGAVVGGTEEATQQILEAAESIDNAATALSRVTSPDQQKLLSEEIQERVVSIFEACNFQDLLGGLLGAADHGAEFAIDLGHFLAAEALAVQHSDFPLGAVDGVIDQIEFDLEFLALLDLGPIGLEHRVGVGGLAVDRCPDLPGDPARRGHLAADRAQLVHDLLMHRACVAIGDRGHRHVAGNCSFDTKTSAMNRHEGIPGLR